MVPMSLGSPPPSIIPKQNKQQKLKFLDIDAHELARQLTILESNLYQQIRPMECLQRAREQNSDKEDNITVIIHTSNRVSCLMFCSVLRSTDVSVDRGLGG
jgi:son of sevenless